jgi:hypothetical protein
VSETADRIGQTLFPRSIRPFLTFRWMTLFVFVISVPDVILKLTVKLPRDRLPLFQHQERLFKSASFLVSYNILLLIGFGLVGATRKKTRLYWLRVLVFGMLFGGVVGQLLIILIPWRT